MDDCLSVTDLRKTFSSPNGETIALRDNNGRAISDSPTGLYGSYPRATKANASSPPQGSTNLASIELFFGDTFALRKNHCK